MKFTVVIFNGFTMNVKSMPLACALNNFIIILSLDNIALIYLWSYYYNGPN